ncbi:hypothetical protein BS47DRAFT_1206908 [Hydnum rufescens UP504]|uniref:Uncharacterized protein n=1 Tax=Hydnum rufescens UP504 TaxID=1448309 RepID=A0A9P6ATA8_9AGAM|nr:hypothetical protein BS47DRAFT_1206908 [Hydnum rufescens UP504]
MPSSRSGLLPVPGISRILLLWSPVTTVYDFSRNIATSGISSNTAYPRVAPGPTEIMVKYRSTAEDRFHISIRGAVGDESIERRRINPCFVLMGL